MSFYHNGKVKKEDQVDPIIFMLHEDQPEEEVLDVDEAMARGIG